MHVYLHSTTIVPPKMHQLDFLERNGKTVRLIHTVATNWKTVADRLYFKNYDINRIERANHSRKVSACRAMFNEWLNGEGRQPATWNTLIKVLREANLSEIVSDLKDVLGMIVNYQL